MRGHAYRVSDHLQAEKDESADRIILKARDEVGRGKRFGMSGEIEMDPHEAEVFAKWVFAQELASQE